MSWLAWNGAGPGFHSRSDALIHGVWKEIISFNSNYNFYYILQVITWYKYSKLET